jgi:hypothetical protein
VHHSTAAWIAVALAVATTSARADQAPPPRPPLPAGGDVDARTLTAKEVDRYLEPYVDRIRACYLGRGKPPATRLLRLELIIHRDGSVFRLGVVTPQLARATARKVEACVRAEAAGWHFPVRRGFTHVAVPFYFHRADPRGAGPYESCWSRRGCPGQGDVAAPGAGTSKEQRP